MSVLYYLTAIPIWVLKWTFQGLPPFHTSLHMGDWLLFNFFNSLHCKHHRLSPMASYCWPTKQTVLLDEKMCPFSGTGGFWEVISVRCGYHNPQGLFQIPASLSLQRKIGSPWLGMEGLNVDFDSSVWLTVPDLICQSHTADRESEAWRDTMHVRGHAGDCERAGIPAHPSWVLVRGVYY